MRIIYDHNVLKESTERLFPLSRHRSARIRKKLLKRFGGEFRKVPCMWQVGGSGGVLYAHPSFKAKLEDATMKTHQPSPAGFGYAPDGMPRYTGFLR